MIYHQLYGGFPVNTLITPRHQRALITILVRAPTKARDIRKVLNKCLAIRNVVSSQFQTIYTRRQRINVEHYLGNCRCSIARPRARLNSLPDNDTELFRGVANARFYRR